MKTLHKFLLAGFLATGIAANGQSNADQEVPGDNFSLEGALELFKKSASPEEFERLLNSADSKVNNLDLNSDGNIDYIRVIDRKDGNIHAFILQAVLSQDESQDVAVIELEKLDNGKAVLQITGDADVYGIETIIEPSDEVRVNAGTSTERVAVNVWTWPSVQYVYGPYYSMWASPWGWSYYPGWWSPWHPVAYYVYSPWWRPYRPYYSVCHYHRPGFGYYTPYRRTSVIVYNNYRGQIDRYRSHYGTRYDGRSDRYSHRFDGYGGRTRSDYHHSDNNHDNDRRANVNGTNGRYRTSETTRSTTRQREANTDNSRTMRERTDYRSSTVRTQDSSTPQERTSPQRTERSTPDFSQQRSQYNATETTRPSTRQRETPSGESRTTNERTDYRSSTVRTPSSSNTQERTSPQRTERSTPDFSQQRSQSHQSQPTQRIDAARQQGSSAPRSMERTSGEGGRGRTSGGSSSSGGHSEGSGGRRSR